MCDPVLLRDPDKWCVITTYKNNFELMEAFVGFYRRQWGIRRFYFLIGITGSHDPIPTGRINRLGEVCDAEIYTLTFSTRDIIPRHVWGAQKRQYFTELNSVIPEQYTRVLNIDNDEFYSVQRASSLDESPELHFHVVEFIPNETLHRSAPLRWSLQGWFYRANFFRRVDVAEVRAFISPAELALLERDLPHNDESSLQITHQWCKVVRFDRKQILTPWAHADGGPLCSAIQQLGSAEEMVALLHANHLCYHVGVLDRQHLLHVKPKWLNTATGYTRTQTGDLRNGRDLFRLYYDELPARTFEDERLRPYWEMAPCGQ